MMGELKNKIGLPIPGLIFLAAGLLLLWFGKAGPAWAAEEDAAGLDEILSGFEDSYSEPESESSPGSSEQKEDDLSGTDWESGFDDDMAPTDRGEEEGTEAADWYQFSGALQLAASYTVSHDRPGPGQADFRKLSRWRPKLDLELELHFMDGWNLTASGQGFYDFAYAMKGRSQFTEEVLEDYEYEAELTEAYLQGRLLPRLDLKIGRQIVVWGKSDNLRVTDVLNPMDNREPGLVDIEDLRLPVAMVRLDYYWGASGNWNVAAILIPEIRFGKDPVFGSEFFPFNEGPVAAYFKDAAEKIPADKPRNYEYALAVNGLFTGWDLSLYGARFFDDRYHPLLRFLPGPPGLAVELRHSELYMAGAAANVAMGNWLLKAEAAYLKGFEYHDVKGNKARLDFLLGLEYTGLTDTTMSIEAANQHMFAFEGAMAESPNHMQEDSFQGVLRITRSFLHETLQITLLASVLGERGQDGAFERLSATYDITDALEMSGGFVLYQGGDNVFFRNI